jgi:Xaa-Pro aminopeptidase
MKHRSKFIQIFCWLIVSCLQISQLTAQSYSNEEFTKRRQQFISQIDKGSIAVFTARKPVIRNSDEEYVFRQESDFYYLSGWEETESAFLLIPGAEKEFIMFVQPKNPWGEMWTGKKMGVEAAIKIFGADTAYSYYQFMEMLPEILRGHDKVYYNLSDEEINQQIISLLKEPRWFGMPGMSLPPEILEDPSVIIHTMRRVKSDYEMEQIKKAIDITCDAQIEAMKMTAPGMNECEVEAVIEYTFRKNGSPRVGFSSIVGAGEHTTVMHYMENNAPINNGDLLLIDIGAEYGYYSADITRTIPVNGKFSKEQKEIYQIVLDAQEKVIETLKPGVHFKEWEKVVGKVLAEGLYKLGLITDTSSDWQVKLWYPHSTSHWLGLDTHDAGFILTPDGTDFLQLKPGMVLTVEPGIYIGKAYLKNIHALLGDYLTGVPEEEITAFVKAVEPIAKKYMNIGIRIEDDVLITEKGCEVLSAKAPKELDDIESIMKIKSSFCE